MRTSSGSHPLKRNGWLCIYCLPLLRMEEDAGEPASTRQLITGDGGETRQIEPRFWKASQSRATPVLGYWLWVGMLEFRKTLFSFIVTLFFGSLFQQQVDLYPT